MKINVIIQDHQARQLECKPKRRLSCTRYLNKILRLYSLEA